jgi:hypothetical protein
LVIATESLFLTTFSLQKLFSSIQSMTYNFPKQTDEPYELPNFQFDFPKDLETQEKPLTLASTRRRLREKQQKPEKQTTVATITNMCDSKSESGTSKEVEIITYTEDELEEFKESMVAKNTKKAPMLQYAV